MKILLILSALALTNCAKKSTWHVNTTSNELLEQIAMQEETIERLEVEIEGLLTRDCKKPKHKHHREGKHE